MNRSRGRVSADYFTPVAKTVSKCGLCFSRETTVTSIFLNPAVFEKLVQLHFAEAEPVIGIKFAGALKAVAEQIEDDEPAAFPQDAVRAGDRVLGMDARDAKPG